MTDQASPDLPSLRVGGRDYFGWLSLRVTRQLNRMATDFDISVSEHWPKLEQVWQIRPFDAVEIRIGDDLVLTGYVDVYNASLTDRAHTVKISGRSKTADLIDCTPEVSGAEFRRSTLDALARAVCAQFSIEVSVETDVGGPLNVAAQEKNETGFAFLERLARLRGVLLTDDERGRLVLTRAGAGRAAGQLVQGQNLVEAGGEINVSRRFSRYIVRSQTGSRGATQSAGDDDEREEEGDGAGASGGDVQVAVRGEATDPEVPRNRPTTIQAEGAANGADAVRRAEWQRNYNNGQSKKIKATVKGWRQRDGALWRINQLIPVQIPALQTDAELLVAGVTFELGKEGARTLLELGPPEGFTPEPAAERSGGGGGGGRLLGFDQGAFARSGGAG